MGYISNPGGVEITSGTYVGNDSANRAIPHGLGRLPAFVGIVRDVSGAQGWIIADSGFVCSRSAEYAVTAADTVNFYVGNIGNYPSSMNGNLLAYTWYAIG